MIAVVLPPDPTEIDCFAAEELARYLSAALGWECAVRSGGPRAGDGPVFWVREIDRATGIPAMGLGETAPKLVEDGVGITGDDGRNVFLVGKGLRGPLNAVYAFLERSVGCRWPEPGQEYVPKLDGLDLSNVRLTCDPPFRYRGLGIHGPCSPEYFGKLLDWMGKNRVNGVQLFPAHYEEVRPVNLGEITKRGILPNIGGHSRGFFYPASEYFEDHPEHFAMIDGQRVRRGQICYSNLDSLPEYAANVIEYLEGRPEIKMVGLWPQDGSGFCECEKCKSAELSEALPEYINRLAALINAELPDMLIEYLSYHIYTDPPKTVKPLPSVVPTYCEYWSRTQFHPITTDLKKNAKCRAELAGWIAIAREVTLFSYYGDDVINRYVYNPVEDVVVADLRHYERMGLAGNFVLLTNPETWWSNAPHMYAYARAAWDREVDVEAIRRDYYDTLYGPAARALRAHAVACRALFELETPLGLPGQEIAWHMVMPEYNPAAYAKTLEMGEPVLSAIKAALEEARAAGGGPFAEARISKIEDDAEYVELLWQTVLSGSKLRAEPTQGNREAYLGLADRLSQCRLVTEDDCRLRCARVLTDLSRGLIGDDEAVIRYADPAAVREYNTRGVGRWTPAHTEGSTEENPSRIVIEATDRITSAGMYEVTWDFLFGLDRLMLLSVGLCSSRSSDAKPEDMTLLSENVHRGFCWRTDTDNTYTLELDQREPGTRYFIVGLAYNESGIGTHGQVLLNRKTEG